MNGEPLTPAKHASLFLAVVIALSLAGVLSLALAPLGTLAPAGVDPDVFKWLSLVQPALLAVAGAVLGYVLAHRVGLDAPVLGALVTKQEVKPVIARQLGPGLIGGAVSGLVLITYLMVVGNELEPTVDMPLVTKLLYGGITEEIIARWGLMSLGVWIAVKFSKSNGLPSTAHYWIGNIFAAGLFSAGHLPVLFASSVDTSPMLIAAVLWGNMLPALMFGFLFRQRGLEAAMIAHATAHLVGAAYLAGS